MKKAPSTKRKKRSIKNNKLRFVVILAVLVYVSWTMITQQIEIQGKKREISKVAEQIANEEQIKQQLDKRIETVSSREYLERAAREQLGFARPEEIIFYDATLKK